MNRIRRVAVDEGAGDVAPDPGDVERRRLAHRLQQIGILAAGQVGGQENRRQDGQRRHGPEDRVGVRIELAGRVGGRAGDDETPGAQRERHRAQPADGVAPGDNGRALDVVTSENSANRAVHGTTNTLMDTCVSVTEPNSQTSSRSSDSDGGGAKARTRPTAIGTAERYISGWRRPRRDFRWSETEPIKGSTAASMIRARAIAADALAASTCRTWL